MSTTSERLSANLSRSYAAYKSGTPFVLPAIGPKSADRRPNIRSPQREHVAMYRSLPGQNQYSVLGQTAYGSRQSCDNFPDSFEYEVDNAAGIPSTSVFRKQYSLPRNRYGRSGGTWRHICQTTAQAGSNLLYIDGAVKDSDIREFPPYGIVYAPYAFNHLGQRLIPKRKSNAKNPQRVQNEYLYKRP